jgi:iron-sulfur cluster repair protein YtfE (RIC family)
MNTTRKEGRVWALSAPLEVVTFDIYRNIHKGIRAELFGVTGAAGSVDPQDERAVGALTQRVRGLVTLLDGHAAHEEQFLTPLIQRQSGSLASAITDDHGALEGQIHQLASALETLPSGGPARRLAVHRFYLGVASFTSAYLEHQAAEELDVMPALATGYTVGELSKVNDAIVSHIPPEAMAASLSLLLPAMNVEDRTEMLAGVKASAPAPAFAGILGIARSVLAPADYEVLATRVV